MIEVGSTVQHATHGKGTVIGRWGSWLSCRQCFIELSPSDRECPECKFIIPLKSTCSKCGHKHTIMDGRDRCVECGSLLAPNHWTVNGSDIFDVQFQKGIKPVNDCRLKEIHA